MTTVGGHGAARSRCDENRTRAILVAVIGPPRWGLFRWSGR